MTLALGIDVGGTGIKSGLINQTGAILAQRYDPIAPGMTFAALLELAANACNALTLNANEPISGIGLATPGHVDPQTQTFLDGGENLGALTQGSLSLALAERLQTPVLVENDGLAATWGEALFGTGRGIDRFMLITLGTGVGGGICLEGKLQRGPAHQPPELGAIVLDINGPPNAHGQPGTLETFAGKQGFLDAFAKEGLIGGTLPDHFARAAAGEPAAVRAVETVSFRIAQALGAVVNSCNLQRCIIGGGISAAGETLLTPIRRNMALTVWPALLANLDIVRSQTGNNAGLLGAASLVFTTLE